MEGERVDSQREGTDQEVDSLGGQINRAQPPEGRTKRCEFAGSKAGSIELPQGFPAEAGNPSLRGGGRGARERLRLGEEGPWDAGGSSYFRHELDLGLW